MTKKKRRDYKKIFLENVSHQEFVKLMEQYNLRPTLSSGHAKSYCMDCKEYINRYIGDIAVSYCRYCRTVYIEERFLDETA